MENENQEGGNAAPKVVSISGTAMKNDKGVNENCIRALEEWLEQARSGDLVGVAMVGQCHDGGTQKRRSGFIRPTRVAGHMMELIHEMFMDLYEKDE